MKNYITIDGGTTNTRVTLVLSGEIKKTVKIPLGARASMDGRTALRTAIRDAINSLLSEFGCTTGDICRILASGMITSEYGLCCLPHVISPAGIRELHETVHEAILSDISDIPFVFVRGVKMLGQTLETTDMMRGEESELIGIMKEGDGACLYVLPGSHSKLIECDTNGRIVRFSTTMTGEMIAALSSGTILRDAVDLSVSEFDEAMLISGCRYAAERGFSEAVFKTRVLKNVFGAGKAEIYSFFLGTILSSEIKAILDSGPEKVVLGGKAQLKNATAILLRALSKKEVVTLSDADVDASSCRGVIHIFEYQA